MKWRLLLVSLYWGAWLVMYFMGMTRGSVQGLSVMALATIFILTYR